MHGDIRSCLVLSCMLCITLGVHACHFIVFGSDASLRKLARHGHPGNSIAKIIIANHWRNATCSFFACCLYISRISLASRSCSVHLCLVLCCALGCTLTQWYFCSCAAILAVACALLNVVCQLHCMVFQFFFCMDFVAYVYMCNRCCVHQRRHFPFNTVLSNLFGIFSHFDS